MSTIVNKKIFENVRSFFPQGDNLSDKQYTIMKKQFIQKGGVIVDICDKSLTHIINSNKGMPFIPNVEADWVSSSIQAKVMLDTGKFAIEPEKEESSKRVAEDLHIDCPPKKKQNYGQPIKPKNAFDILMKPKYSQNWSTKGSLLLYKHPESKPSEKIAAFDLDGSIILPMDYPRKKFCRKADDWRFLAHMDEIIRTLHKDGYKIIICTNQKGLSHATRGQSNRMIFKARLELIQQKLDVPFQALCATKDDFFRKPRIGMWEYFTGHMNGGIPVDLVSSFFQGDAANRPNDHSDCDLKFALNARLPFYVPEETQMGRKESRIANKAHFPFDPRNFDSSPCELPNEMINSTQQQMIVLVGSPASGKSTFSRHYFSHYTRINQDTLKSKENCLRSARKSLENGESIIIDNTNRSVKVRSEWIRLAREFHIDCIACVMDSSLHLVNHLNLYRKFMLERNPDFPSKPVPELAIRQFFDNFETVNPLEGFSLVENVKFKLMDIHDAYGMDLVKQFLEYIKKVEPFSYRRAT
eukprot:TRINITY_DN1550_c0_g1_i1.p1 TRINITY_DN1550_c0_g1~~TRINITY_DN1550_c0_g1_i1.p1  ORF type:complete len:526 (-),score=101.85 TRINITY_DN1550_c0_g1_i1:32-1609(-)